ncbi:hypothetical protein DFP72DRAFT_848859 [Ephemerocybe angulata]|uniref:Uncharacterized protein n=1 Tax=Ephemerocybe angulata TaxID=980116 RepID=A0A8H6HX59_9AGAR|nr:hypothetical protein DFP72DRAFT_848859 [Tulosesus angulatus]
MAMGKDASCRTTLRNLSTSPGENIEVYFESPNGIRTVLTLHKLSWRVIMAAARPGLMPLGGIISSQYEEFLGSHYWARSAWQAEDTIGQHREPTIQLHAHQILSHPLPNLSLLALQTYPSLGANLPLQLPYALARSPSRILRATITNRPAEAAPSPPLHPAPAHFRITLACCGAPTISVLSPSSQGNHANYRDATLAPCGIGRILVESSVSSSAFPSMTVTRISHSDFDAMPTVVGYNKHNEKIVARRVYNVPTANKAVYVLSTAICGLTAIHYTKVYCFENKEGVKASGFLSNSDIGKEAAIAKFGPIPCPFPLTLPYVRGVALPTFNREIRSHRPLKCCVLTGSI